MTARTMTMITVAMMAAVLLGGLGGLAGGIGWLPAGFG